MTTVEEPSVGWETAGAGTTLSRAGLLVGPELRKAVQRLAEPVRTVAGFHLGWWAPAGAPVLADATDDLRAALVLACAEGLGGSWQTALAPARAIELVHHSWLLHDDVMECTLSRGGRPTAWTVFGRSQALLAGDALLVLGMSSLTGHPLTGELSGALLDLIAGQGADLTFDERFDTDLFGAEVEERLTVTAGKAGALFGGACALGAISAGASPATTAQLRQFGRGLGLAAHIVDDLRACRDGCLRKRSLLVAAALSSCTKAARRLGELFARPERLSVAETAEATWLVEKAGGYRWAEQAVVRQRTQALDCLAEANLAPGPAAALRVVADLVITHGCREGQRQTATG